MRVAVVLGLTLLLGKTAQHLPPAVVALFWAALSLYLSLGFAYHVVIGKSYNRAKFEDGGIGGRVNKGRFLTLIVSFVLAAVLVAGLVIEAPTWTTLEWVLVALAVPLYILVSTLVERRIAKEYTPLFRHSRTALWSAAITGVLLCVAFAIASFLQPHPQAFANAAQAFQFAMHPFEGAQSALVREAGAIVALADTFTHYAASRVGEASPIAYTVLQLILHASALFGVANLLGACSLSWPELRRVFLPLNAGPTTPLATRYVAVAAILPIVLVAGFCLADNAVAKATATQEYSAAERLVRSQISEVVYLIDGKYYDKEAVDKLVAQSMKASQALSDEARNTLVPLINASYDARIANIDSYLDWYYSLPADYERLAKMVTGSAEDFVKEQFAEHIEAGIDDSEIAQQLEAYAQKSADLVARFEADLSKYEVLESDVPQWLTQPQEVSLESLESKSLAPTHQLSEAPARLGISAAAGIGASILAKRLVEKVLSRAFGKAIVSSIARVIPFVGVPLSVGIDFAWLKVEEQLNRDAYKQEITDLINEERAQALQLVGAS